MNAAQKEPSKVGAVIPDPKIRYPSFRKLPYILLTLRLMGPQTEGPNSEVPGPV